MKKPNSLLLLFAILLGTSSILAVEEEIYYCFACQGEGTFLNEYQLDFYNSSLSLEELRREEDAICNEIKKIAYLNTKNPSTIDTIDISSEGDETKLDAILKNKALPFKKNDIKYLKSLKIKDFKKDIKLPKRDQKITSYYFLESGKQTYEFVFELKEKPIQKKQDEFLQLPLQDEFLQLPLIDNYDNESDDYLTIKKLGCTLLFFLCVFCLLLKKKHKKKITVSLKKEKSIRSFTEE